MDEDDLVDASGWVLGEEDVVGEAVEPPAESAVVSGLRRRLAVVSSDLLRQTSFDVDAFFREHVRRRLAEAGAREDQRILNTTPTPRQVRIEIDTARRDAVMPFQVGPPLRERRDYHQETAHRLVLEDAEAEAEGWLQDRRHYVVTGEKGHLLHSYSTDQDSGAYALRGPEAAARAREELVEEIMGSQDPSHELARRIVAGWDEVSWGPRARVGRTSEPLDRAVVESMVSGGATPLRIGLTRVDGERAAYLRVVFGSGALAIYPWTPDGRPREHGWADAPDQDQGWPRSYGRGRNPVEYRAGRERAEASSRTARLGARYWERDSMLGSALWIGYMRRLGQDELLEERLEQNHQDDLAFLQADGKALDWFGER